MSHYISWAQINMPRKKKDSFEFQSLVKSLRNSELMNSKLNLKLGTQNCPRRTGMTKLSVNLNKVALLRNARTIGIPSVVKAAADLCRGWRSRDYASSPA